MQPLRWLLPLHLAADCVRMLLSCSLSALQIGQIRKSTALLFFFFSSKWVLWKMRDGAGGHGAKPGAAQLGHSGENRAGLMGAKPGQGRGGSRTQPRSSCSGSPCVYWPPQPIRGMEGVATICMWNWSLGPQQAHDIWPQAPQFEYIPLEWG